MTMFLSSLADFASRNGAKASLLAIPLLAAAASAHASPSPAPAQGQSAAANSEKERPITDKTVRAEDVATSPLADLNVKKEGIPAILISAQERPYDLAGLNSCPRIAHQVNQLNAVLGDDIDVQAKKGGGLTPGGVAKSVVDSFIPFRGVIRELSGANAQDRKVQSAIYAGTARRAFLKGVGQQRGCGYPARSITMAMAKSRAAAIRNAR